MISNIQERVFLDSLCAPYIRLSLNFHLVSERETSVVSSTTNRLRSCGFHGQHEGACHAA